MGNHPAFEKAKEKRRWAGPLAELWPVLRREAYDIGRATGGEKDQWAFRIVPHGALVALRIRPDFRKELRIARPEPIETEEQRRKWIRECGTFLKHFGFTGSEHVEEKTDKGVAARFIELYHHEHAVGLATCTDCGADTPSTPIVEPMRCGSCKSEHRLRETARRTAAAPSPNRRRERANLELMP